MRGLGGGCTAATAVSMGSVGDRAPLGRSPLRTSFPSHTTKPPSSKALLMAGSTVCSNEHCRRTSPGDGPTCRWHVRNYGSVEEPVHVTLCNACKINFDQGKYCPFCVQIYREKDPDSFDGKEWVGCTNRGCRRWVHAECELAEGNDLSSSFGDSPYLCPPCRENAEAGERRRLGRHNAADRLGAPNGMEKTVVGSPLSQGSDGEECRADKSGSRSCQASPTDKKPYLAKSFSWSGTRPFGLRSDSRSSSPSGSMRQTPNLKVDLSKLQASSLRKYKRVYKLRDVPGGCSKEGLKMAVAQHFASLIVNEEDILRGFLKTFVRKQNSLVTSQCTGSLRGLKGLAREDDDQDD